MSEILAFLDSSEKILLATGVILIVVGVLSPRKIIGIQLDWSRSRSAAAVFFGLLLVLLSLPQVRAWGDHRQPSISAATIDAIRRNTQNGRDNAWGASTNTSDLRGCLAATTTAYQQLDEALRLIDELRASLQAPTKT